MGPCMCVAVGTMVVSIVGMSTSFLVPRCPTARHIEPIQRRQRRYNAKFRNYSTEIICVCPLAPVLFLLFWYLRKMVLRACVLIVELSIILLFDIVILFHVWMTCLMN